ncbi:contact-dependent growth inhibition system immunity protein [Rubritalea halochordaticola]
MEYPHLMDFLAAWFPDADLMGFETDVAVVKRYREVTPTEEVQKSLDELDDMLSKDVLPLELVDDRAWRTFDHQEEAREWLTTIRNALASPV